MDNNCFTFLKDDFPEIYDCCNKAEVLLINHDYDGSIKNSGKALEGLAIEWGKVENLGEDFDNLIFQNDRIEQLFKEGILSKKERSLFRFVKNVRNDDAHYETKGSPNTHKSALYAHENVYNLTTKFYQTYINQNFIIPEYSGPIFKNDNVKELKEYIDYKVETINSNKLSEDKILELKEEIIKEINKSNSKDKDELKNYINDSIKNSSSGDVYNITNSFNTHDTSNIDIKKTNAQLSNTEVNNSFDLNQKQINNTNVGIETNNTVNDTKLDINQTRNDIKNTKNSLNLKDNRKNINNYKELGSKGSSNIKYIFAALIVILAAVVAGAYVAGVFDSDSNDVTSNLISSSDVGNVDLSNPYWASINSGKFHKSDCEWAHKIPTDNLKTYPDRDSAIKDGMIPCHVCNP